MRPIPFPTLFLLPFLLMIATGVILPSDGGHGILSPKGLTFIAAAASLMIHIAVSGKFTRRELKTLLFVMTTSIFLILWFLIGFLGAPLPLELQADHLKLFVITLFVPIAAYYWIEQGILTPATFYRTLIFSSFLYVSAKILLVTLHFVGVVDAWELLKGIGFRFMRMNITGDLDRLQTSADILTPYILFFALQSDSFNLRLSRTFRCLYFVLATLSVILSFSRYLFAIYLCVLLFHWITLRLRSFLKAALAGIIIASALVYAAGPERVSYAFERRFFSGATSASDQIRVNQINAMTDTFEHSPYLGTGLGSYAKEEVRDRLLPYSYEVQWVSFLMQFGLAGLAILLAPALWLFMRLLNGPWTRQRLAWASLFVIFLLSGFTNPFLISLASGILYAAFLIATLVLNPPLQLSSPHTPE